MTDKEHWSTARDTVATGTDDMVSHSVNMPNSIIAVLRLSCHVHVEIKTLPLGGGGDNRVRQNTIKNTPTTIHFIKTSKVLHERHSGSKPTKEDTCNKQQTKKLTKPTGPSTGLNIGQLVVITIEQALRYVLITGLS